VFWLPSCKIVRDIGKMEEEADRIDKHDGADEWRYERRCEEMSSDDRSVRVGDEDESVPPMMFQDFLYFLNHNLSSQCGSGQSRAHRHDLNCNYPELGMIFDMYCLIDIMKKISVWV